MTTELERIIRDAGESWLVDFLTSPQEAIPRLHATLEEVNEHARSKLDQRAPNLSVEALVLEFQSNPTKVKAFFQVLGGTKSPDMLLMAWRIMQGLEIKTVEISYRRQQEFHARVMLGSPYEDRNEYYESMKIQDFALFRHLGILEINDRPVLDGFYALNLQD